MLPTLKRQDFELTMEQQFRLVRYTQQVEEIPPEKLRAILLEILRQLMIKNNLLRALVRKP
ncbi:NblA/ycf18 family protein [Aetokthonos hydrillicola Thurmond2011]|jgi:DNA-directed RNA polymerase subunit F|uniref:NblA/ycf18 family protein n=1 Tax=Aetokthonos hydrillicola Thurmond2011 TaxID=2712845 RepID=A0AAP5IGU4_9CYAN|nr:NblA/ycf18 family protein [Aetokthonos hydrillicola]MBO3463991.1 phycobilisome degradation protein nblA [Aetokthonos hydrillicola CCALA 1050]MBW4591192.1 NblA/ycf18 family protein [Aetokthonos hydrillicola CCALA 1050]MDR9899713.1 NblA/ycf18 family protein [Aetokthonos hydrillicola Thurmond2011]